MKKKIKSFNDVRKYLSNVSYINAGGCGISTLAMQRWRDKNLKKNKSELIYLFAWSDDENYKDCLKQVKSKKVVEAPYHCGLKIGLRIKDCEKICKKSEYPARIKLTEKQLVKSINKVYSWNCMFDRKNINKISTDLNINLSDIKCH